MRWLFNRNLHWLCSGYVKSIDERITFTSHWPTNGKLKDCCPVCDRWSVCCCQIGRQTPRPEITAEDERSSTSLHRWQLTCRWWEWSLHQEPSQRVTTPTPAAVVEGVAGGFPKSCRAIWTHCVYWTHRLRRRRSQEGLGRRRGACRGSHPWVVWTLGSIEAATEPRSSTAPLSGTPGK